MTVESPKFHISDAGMRHNIETLAANSYPGRGIVLGRSENPDELVEAYWVMGRSENSRNRRLVEDGNIVKTVAHDPSKMEDPSLIIYNAMRLHEGHKQGMVHIVSNGNQTDTVYDIASRNETAGVMFPVDFRGALFMHDFEPDNPNFTARITGAIAIGSVLRDYKYSIIRRNPATGQAEHTFGGGEIDDIPAGAGLCFHTYEEDGNPLPTFKGSPYAVPLGANANEIAEELWDVLDVKNRVGLAVRAIDSKSGDIKATSIINQLG